MTSGKLLNEEAVASKFLVGQRAVRVYLPPSYASEKRRRYPVLYVHDGQNVFSSAGPHCCYGWGSWELDRTVDRLVAGGRMQEIIMVGVDHGRSRYKELRGRLHSSVGKKRKDRILDETLDNTRFDAYANFLIKELKRKMDREFRTLKTAANTGVMGSSLGGIASLALGWEFPRVFGRVASLSGSFNIESRNFIEQVLGHCQRTTRSLQVYLDSGTIDDSGDDDDRRHTDAVADQLRRLGWKDGKNLLRYTEGRTLTEPELEAHGLGREKWYEAQRSQHNEFYWRLRVWRALEFLFPPKK